MRTCAFVVVALALGAARAEDGASVPESLQEFLDEKGADNRPIVGPDERSYIAKLPEHTRALLGKVGEDRIGGANQLQMLLSLRLSPQAFELVLQDRCVMCHTDVDNLKPSLTFSLDPDKAGAPHTLNLKELVADVHFRRGLLCAGCHGGDPNAELMGAEISRRWPAKDVRKKDRTWIPEFCARCHSDPVFMRGFNPSLPTDQLAKYKDSQHGILLLAKKDSNAAQCVSCHGVHGIRGPKSRQSMVFPRRVPETCGACHADPKHMAGYTNAKGEPLPTNQLEHYKVSVHGVALLEKDDLTAAACNDCHGNHAAMPPAVASVSQVCRTCHLQNGQLFDGSKHKEKFEKHGWPECERCHGKHDIQRPTEALMLTKPGALCYECHQQYSQGNPDCQRAANYFHDTLADLVAGEKRLSAAIEHVAERGIDVEPLSFKASDLQEAIVHARTRIHAFDTGNFDAVAEPGRQALADGEKLLGAAQEEFRFRRMGLLGAVCFMGLLAFALFLKVRQLEKRG